MERVAIKAEMASFARERQALEIIFRSGSSLAIFECGDCCVKRRARDRSRAVFT